MKLSEHSKNRFYKSFQEYDVPREYAEPIFNYFVYGYGPGSFFTSLLANDAMSAIMRSHPANTIDSLKMLVTWLENSRSRSVIWGDYDTINRWCRAAEGYRRAVLENIGLIYSEDQEMMLVLRGEQPDHVVLY